MADADTGAMPVDQDALVAGIDRTRTELARTIDAIADRVSPKKNVDRAMAEVRQSADQTMKQVRERADQTMKQVREHADQTMKQVRERVSQLDPNVVGAAVAGVVVVVSVTTLFLWRRSRR
jgi:ElaB/YqjD/DUF883 family membrane-anchored ribosome-binding protein